MGAPSSWLNLCTKIPRLKRNQGQQQDNNILTLSPHHCYGKIPKNKPRGLYVSKALFEEVIFGGAYVRTEICVSKSIGLAYSWKEIYCFCFVLLRIRGQFPSKSLRGSLYSEGRFNGGCFAWQVYGAYIWRGLFSEFYSIFLLLCVP